MKDFIPLWLLILAATTVFLLSTLAFLRTYRNWLRTGMVSNKTMYTVAVVWSLVVTGLIVLFLPLG